MQVSVAHITLLISHLMPHLFQSLVVACRSASLILSLFHLMAGSTIPDVRSDPEKAMLKLQARASWKAMSPPGSNVAKHSALTMLLRRCPALDGCSSRCHASRVCLHARSRL